ncbi:hypothetical protein J437_LFUL012725 [Ladona fulva]|uniref:Small ribosomal subunit protein uS5m n=1 Tax=Ladona fulva TaxID=123851 RepID=A0A8K0PC51_LADFU|nr:hypothetical protein J437_LFUL012725 [Ladona fulva]
MVPSTSITMAYNVIIRFCGSFSNTLLSSERMPAEQIWKGVTSVSNAGKKRGRGKGVGKKMAKNLNRGQVIGFGKANIVWPGLNAPIFRGREIVQREQLPEDKERFEKILKMRDEMGTYRPLRLSPLERGWSGTKMPGRSIGPPDPIGEGKHFDGFDTKVLEMKTVFNMKGNLGRTRRMSVFVVTGNKNGLAGFALGKAVDVYHDFFCQFGKVKLFVQKKPEGYGLVCHRAVKTVCEVLGIKDLYAKVEGSTNLQHIVMAFFHGLLKQKTYQQIAEEKGLHVVEICKEAHNFPKVLASPTNCLTKDEVDPTEMDFNQHVLDGKVRLQKKKFPKFYTLLPSYQKHLKHIRLQLRVEYGEVRSFLADKYPECVAPKFQKKVDSEIS